MSDPESDPDLLFQETDPRIRINITVRLHAFYFRVCFIPLFLICNAAPEHREGRIQQYYFVIYFLEHKGRRT